MKIVRCVLIEKYKEKYLGLAALFMISGFFYSSAGESANKKTPFDKKGSLKNEVIQLPAGSIQSFWLEPLDKTEKSKANFQPTQLQISSFESQIYPVSNREFINFLNKNPEWQKESVSKLFADESYLNDFKDRLNLKKGVSLGAPVTYVSWFAANAYCESLKMRLPTTSEWEYMASASETKADASNDDEFLKRILEWYSEPQGAAVPKVGTVYKNLYGVWDLHGLVWEWVEDFNSNFVTGESREDSSLNRNLFCGAGALAGGNKRNYSAFMRFAFRSSLKGKSSVSNLGFRCVRSR